MIVLMSLLVKTSDYVIYRYGYDKSNLDGEIKLSLKNPMNYEIIKQSNDKRINKSATMKAIIKLIKSIERNKVEEYICYQT